MSLLTLQRDFQHWLTREPAELPRSFGAEHRAGLGVYLNNYRSQLLACLCSSYPAVLAMVGEDAFHAAAARCIDARPPSSWTLDAYAEELPEVLVEWFADAPHVFELARLELALATVFVGADAEPIHPSRLADVDWETAVIRLTPGFTRLKLSTNAGELWIAIQAGRAPPEPRVLPEPEYLTVWRTQFVSHFRAVTAAEYYSLGRIAEGVSFGRVCQDLVGELGEDAGTAAAGTMLGQWLADGVIVHLGA